MNRTLLFGMPGGGEWIVIAMAALLLFGAKKIPDFARGLGKGIREFNDALKDVKKEINEGTNTPEEKKETGDTN